MPCWHLVIKKRMTPYIARERPVSTGTGAPLVSHLWGQRASHGDNKHPWGPACEDHEHPLDPTQGNALGPGVVHLGCTRLPLPHFSTGYSLGFISGRLGLGAGG